MRGGHLGAPLSLCPGKMTHVEGVKVTNCRGRDRKRVTFGDHKIGRWRGPEK